MRKRNARDIIIEVTPSDMPTIKCIEKPVIRPIINAIITITDRSNGENFTVGKSKQ
jgi:hypothetical protein